MEITSNNYVSQIKGKGNGEVHPRYIKYVLNMLDIMGHSVRDGELKNLGYINLSDELEKFINKHFSNKQIVKIGEKEFFYIKSNLKKIS